MNKQEIDFNKRARWYLLANRSSAVIYLTTQQIKFEFVERISNPSGRLTEGELDSDAPGTGVSSGASSIHHGLDRTFFHHELDAKAFAKRLSRILEKAFHEERFNDLVLVCEPHFLGLLRSELSPALKTIIRHEVNREYAQGSDEEVHQLILQAMELR